ncbi:MAG: chemotaxis protein CheX [Desulfatiglans sp.]|jgi:CheY-specific phosphatase CheX|nr:chemotaxis protein CheX [Desulfatiglans sp.]
MRDLNAIDIESTVSEAVIDVFDTMASMTVESSGTEARTGAKVPRIVASVNIGGEVVGVVNIGVKRSFARVIASEILGMEPEEIEEEDDEVKDVIAEVVNMVGGNLKSVLNDGGFFCELSTPSITTGNNFKIDTLNMSIYQRFGFKYQGDVIIVEVGLKEGEKRATEKSNAQSDQVKNDSGDTQNHAKLSALKTKDLVDDAVVDVFDTMMSFDLDILDADTMDFESSRIVGSVSLTGDISGVISIQVEDGFSRTMAAAMLDMDADEFENDDEIKDVISEVTNIIGGTVKSALNDFGFFCYLTTPSITTGDDFRIESLNMSVHERYSFGYQDDTVIVELGLKTADNGVIPDLEEGNDPTDGKDEEVDRGDQPEAEADMTEKEGEEASDSQELSPDEIAKMLEEENEPPEDLEEVDGVEAIEDEEGEALEEETEDAEEVEVRKEIVNSEHSEAAGSEASSSGEEDDLIADEPEEVPEKENDSFEEPTQDIEGEDVSEEMEEGDSEGEGTSDVETKDSEEVEYEEEIEGTEDDPKGVAQSLESSEEDDLIADEPEGSAEQGDSSQNELDEGAEIDGKVEEEEGDESPPESDNAEEEKSSAVRLDVVGDLVPKKEKASGRRKEGNSRRKRPFLRIVAAAAVFVALLGGLAAYILFEKPRISEIGPASQDYRPSEVISKGAISESGEFGAIDEIVMKIQEIRGDLIVRQQDIIELKQDYLSGIERVEGEILKELDMKAITTLEQAQQTKKTALRLRTIQRRRGLIRKLDEPLEALSLQSEKLLYLKRQIEVHALLAPLVSRDLMSDFVKWSDKLLQDELALSKDISLEMDDLSYPSLNSVWSDLGKRKVNRRPVIEKVSGPDGMNRVIWDEICRGIHDRKHLLTKLSPRAAKCLSEWKGKDLDLSGLKDLSPEVARYLSAWKGDWLILNGLTRLSPETARYLSLWKGENLSLNGLLKLSHEEATYLSQWKGKHLELIGLKHPVKIKGAGKRIFTRHAVRK